MILSYKVRLITYDGICSHNKNLINYSDLIISCLKSTCDFYSKFNKKVFYMPHGFDNRILNNFGGNEKKYDTVFVKILEILIIQKELTCWIKFCQKQI